MYGLNREPRASKILAISKIHDAIRGISQSVSPARKLISRVGLNVSKSEIKKIKSVQLPEPKTDVRKIVPNKKITKPINRVAVLVKKSKKQTIKFVNNVNEFNGVKSRGRGRPKLVRTNNEKKVKKVIIPRLKKMPQEKTPPATMEDWRREKNKNLHLFQPRSTQPNWNFVKVPKKSLPGPKEAPHENLKFDNIPGKKFILVKAFKCDYCKLEFDHVNDRLSHMEKGHLLVCPKCSIAFQNHSDMYLHFKSFSNDKFHCKVCRFSSKELLAMKLHRSSSQHIEKEVINDGMKTDKSQADIPPKYKPQVQEVDLKFGPLSTPVSTNLMFTPPTQGFEVLSNISEFVADETGPSGINVDHSVGFQNDVIDRANAVQHYDFASNSGLNWQDYANMQFSSNGLPEFILEQQLGLSAGEFQPVTASSPCNPAVMRSEVVNIDNVTLGQNVPTMFNYQVPNNVASYPVTDNTVTDTELFANTSCLAGMFL